MNCCTSLTQAPGICVGDLGRDIAKIRIGLNRQCEPSVHSEPTDRPNETLSSSSCPPTAVSRLADRAGSNQLSQVLLGRADFGPFLYTLNHLDTPARRVSRGAVIVSSRPLLCRTQVRGPESLAGAGIAVLLTGAAAYV